MSYYDNEDAMIDNIVCSREKIRSNKLNELDIELKSNELYEQITNVMFKYANKGISRVSLKLHPNCVVDRVIKKLKDKGLFSKHIYNDGYNQFDYLEIDISKIKLN